MELTKRIAVLCDYRLMPERVGGMDRFYWLFDAECKKLGYDVTWFFPNTAQHEGYSELHIITANGKTIEQTFLDFNQPFDVVFTHFVELCTSFYKTVKKHHLAQKIVVVDHNPRPFEGYPIKKRIVKRIKGSLYSPFIDVFVGVSQYTVNEILKDFGNHLKSKTNVIYNGIEYQKFKQRQIRAFAKPSFLVACHLRPSKGIQDLIEAIALLPENIQNEIVIDIYGEGVYQMELENSIKEKVLGSNFVFKGSVANLYDTYYLYDYLLQPTHMECFSLAILESLSANVPVITTPVGGNEEVIVHGQNGYILPVQKPQRWSELIARLYTGTDKITENTCHLIKTQFSIEQMVANYIKLTS